MPTAVAAARQSYADHPMVRLETAPPGPCHAVSLQETLSGTFTVCATVILGSIKLDHTLPEGIIYEARVKRENGLGGNSPSTTGKHRRLSRDPDERIEHGAVDTGINPLATDSEGEIWENPAQGLLPN